MATLPITPGVASALGVPRPDGRGKRLLIAGRCDVTRRGKRTATPAFRALVSKRVAEAACEECRTEGHSLLRCGSAIANVARRFNLRRPLADRMATTGMDMTGPQNAWTGRYDFRDFDDAPAPERAQLEEWERAMERTAPIRELLALVRDMPTAGGAAACTALIERMDEPTRTRVSFAVYRYLTAVDLANSVREQLVAASAVVAKFYEERVAAEPLIASLEVV